MIRAAPAVHSSCPHLFCLIFDRLCPGRLGVVRAAVFTPTAKADDQAASGHQNEMLTRDDFAMI
jgi:hypothetical protein